MTEKQLFSGISHCCLGCRVLCIRNMADRRSLCLMLLLLQNFRGKSQKIIRLEPERPLLNQVLHHKETVLFHLVKLEASRSYELRISYPATTPTDFHIHLVSEEAITGQQIRKLLNIDKLVFDNDAAVTEKFANVTAIRTGVAFDPKRLSDPVLYNIVLEEISFGIPHQAWRVVVALALTVFLTFKYLTPKFLSFIDGHLKRDLEKRKS